MADGRPKVITVWLPLTDATPENSCMYVVPADRDPTYGSEMDYLHQFSLADIRALPAQAGSVLGWDQAVLHWGSHSVNRAVSPRISIACEFQRGDQVPYGAPLFNPAEPPDFATRQVLIGRQILRYEHMAGTNPAWRAVAERMAAGEHVMPEAIRQPVSPIG
jgi:ectoine hydroxylase-related dioxygenase (phytanoyl-CoA dioxygenase family)